MVKHERFSLRTCVMLLVAALIAGITGWSLKTLMSPSHSIPDAPSYALAPAEEGELERTIRLNAKISWEGDTPLLAPASGTLTEIIHENGTITEGESPFSLDLAPVYLAQGNIPAFRNLSLGTQGKDVAQLQRFLSSQLGTPLLVDGDYGERTERLVKKWQKLRGMEETGEIAAGTLIFVPALPAALSWDDKIHVGSRVDPGEPLATISGKHARFTLPLPAGQASMVRDGMDVRINYRDHTWNARIGSIDTDAEGNFSTTLLPAQGERICENQCAGIPPVGETSVEARIVIVPSTRGIIIPSAAIRSADDGGAIVNDAEGIPHPIRVVTQVAGRSIVTGISAGTQVRIPLKDSGEGSTPARPSSGG